MGSGRREVPIGDTVGPSRKFSTPVHMVISSNRIKNRTTFIPLLLFIKEKNGCVFINDFVFTSSVLKK